MRLIDADALKQYFFRPYSNEECYTNLDIEKVIDAQPTIEPKHGRWIDKEDPYGFFDYIPVCSECGCTTKMREKYRYCPNCGARMMNEVEE